MSTQCLMATICHSLFNATVQNSQFYLYALSFFAGSGSGQKFWIHADPDPQHCFICNFSPWIWVDAYPVYGSALEWLWIHISMFSNLASFLGRCSNLKWWNSDCTVIDTIDRVKIYLKIHVRGPRAVFWIHIRVHEDPDPGSHKCPYGSWSLIFYLDPDPRGVKIK